MRLRVEAVSFLNTVPLVWGMLHGEQRSAVDLTFSIPSVCAEKVENGLADVGLVPSAEIARQGLEIVSDVGIACRGTVRSILLISRKPFREIRTLSADLSSRTSVQMAKIILREQYGAFPKITKAPPHLEHMLADADAALVIGDPALLIDPVTLAFECIDLGTEWWRLTNLPMVFAAWAGKPNVRKYRAASLCRSSYEFGRARLNDIVESEYRKRKISRELAAQYLSRFIQFEIGREEQRGMEAFWELAQLPRPVSA